MSLTPLKSDDSPPRHNVYYTPVNHVKQALEIIAPYTNAKNKKAIPYPGRVKIWQGIFGYPISRFTLFGWKRGTDKMPQWARDTLAAHLEREAFARLEIAKELRKCAPPQEKKS